ncbi:plasmid partitioning protein RepB [Cereibacter sp. SYSU M97828]|nr:plasmid partitioning protein RepB [Cereibacter flavus]
MGRKLFDRIAAGSDASDGKASDEVSTSQGRARPVQRMADSLLDMSANSIRLIPLESIESSSIKDRISADDDVEALAASIAAHGQQVPILVRPLPHASDRFQVVYGRRRIAAIRSLGAGRTVKAIVRTLKDEEAIVAQGQENSLRLDPSHIEKSLFARELREQGYSTSVIVDALGVDRFTISRMIKVVDNIPLAIIELIGAAHDIGRRPWKNMSDLLGSVTFDAVSVVTSAINEKAGKLSSSERFHTAFSAIRNEVSLLEQQQLSHGSTAVVLGQDDARPKVEFTSTRDKVSIVVSTKSSQAFHAWLTENYEQLIQDMLVRFEERELQTAQQIPVSPEASVRLKTEKPSKKGAPENR